MAEPLTSSDVFRVERGWGVSPMASSEERRRFAAAGELPISSQDVARLAEGRGISPMASREEKEAFIAAEVMAGRRDPMDLPKSYGGIGERPEATTRRGIRMQEEWDKQYEMMMEQQKIAKEIEAEARRVEAEQRRLSLQEQQEARFQAAEFKKQEEDEKISRDANSAINEILGGIDANGNPIAGLDPDDPNYMEKRNAIIKRYPKAPKDEAFKTAIATTDKSYFDNINFEQQLKKQEESSGRLIERQVAAEERSKERQIEAEERALTRAEEKQKQSQIFGIDKELRKEELALEDVAANLGLQRDQSGRFNIGGLSDTQKKTFRAAENRVRLLEQDKAQLQGFMFDTEADAQAAIEAKRVPKGAIIFINGKKAINR